MGQTRISLAKISRPRLIDAIAHPRLCARLDELRKHPCIWVSAPPGAGKSTTVGTWIQTRRQQAIWYQVDGGDDDLPTFFRYLSRAAQALVPTSPPLPALSPEHMLDLPAFIRRFYRDLFNVLPAQSMLVLDNHHECSASTAFQDMLALAIREVPAGCNLIVVGRSDPPPSLVELEANRMLVRLSWDDLKLNQDEARRVARAVGEFSPAVLDRVVQRCAGWAAGLTLMLQRHLSGVADGELEWHSRNAVFHYFALHYIQEIPQQARSALLKTALVPSLTGAMARALTGYGAMEAVLQTLCRKQFFTRQIGHQPAHYAYHDLFREFLLTHAQQQFATRELRRLRTHAAQLLEKEGRYQDAYPLYRTTENWQDCLRITIAQAPALLAQGRSRTLEDWFAPISQALREQHPWSHYWLGLAQATRDPVQAEATLSQAHAGFLRAGDRIGCALSVGALLETHYFAMSNWLPMRPWLETLDTMLSQEDRWLPPDLHARIYPAMAAALTMLWPGHPRHMLYLERAIRCLHWVQAPSERALACALVLNTLTVRGMHARAARLITQLHATDAGVGTSPLANAGLLAQFGFHYAMTGQPAQGLQYCEQALTLAREHHLEPFMHLAMLNSFIAAVNLCDYARCAEVLARMQATLLPARELDVAMLALLQSWLTLAQRSSPISAGTLDRIIALAEATGSDRYIHVFNVIVAGMYLEIGELEPARSCLGTARSLSAQGGLECYDIMRYTVECRMAQLQQDEPGVAAALHQFCVIATHSGDQLSFLSWLGPRTLSNVLALALARKPMQALATALIRQLRMEPPAHACAQWPWPVRVHTLGGLRIDLNGVPLSTGKKSPNKVLTFLKVLIALGGRKVPMTRIADALWPDEDGDLALESAKVTLHRLRKLLGGMDLFILESGRLSINTSRVWVDVHALNKSTRATVALPAHAPAEFLPEDQDEAWSFAARKHYGELREGSEAL